MSLAACASSEPEREWTPRDHGYPKSAGNAGQALPPEKQRVASADDVKRASVVLYQVRCASCHGEGGLGNGAGKPPGAQMPNFTDPAWQASREDQQLEVAITKGKGLMPAYGKEISPEGVKALVAHVRSFAKQADAPDRRSQ